MVTVETLLQYLYEGDVFGFIQAVYVSGFQSADLLYGVMVMLFTVPAYIRTKSLLFMCIMWILIGGLIMVAMPLVSSVATLLLIFGLAGFLFKLFMSIRS